MKTIIFTDLKPSDYLAILIIIEYYKQYNVGFKDLFIGISCGNVYKKGLILKKLMEEYLDIKENIIYMGSGGFGMDYKEEGKFILTNKQLNRIDNNIISSEHLKRSLDRYFKKNDDINLIFLTNSYDFYIKNQSYAKLKINKILILNEIESKEWLIDMDSTRKLIKLINKYKIDTDIYSCKSMNPRCEMDIDTYPELFEKLIESNKLPIYYLKKMIENLDENVTEGFTNENNMIKIGKDKIGKHLHFESIIAIMGYLHPEIVLESENCIVHLKKNGYDGTEKNYTIKNQNGMFTYIKKYDLKMVEKYILKYLSNYF